MQTPPVLEAFVNVCLAALDSDSPRDTILRETHELFADPHALAAQIPPFTENEVPTSEHGWRLGGEHVLHNDDNLTVIVLDTLPGIAQPPHDHDMSAIIAPANHPARAIHVYLGDIFNVERSVFDPETLAEHPMTPERYDEFCRSAS